jgi:hypothetical protein
VPKTVELGLLTMRIEPSNLIAGIKFIASPCRLVCSPSVGGASFRAWEYIIHARFDRSSLFAELRQSSGSLQNRNLATPVSQLNGSEEIVMAIPTATLKLSSTLDLSSTSTELLGRFTLRDWRPAVGA